MGSPLRHIFRQALSPIILKSPKSPVLLKTASCSIQCDISRSKFLTKCPQLTTSKNGKHISDVLETTKFQSDKTVLEKGLSKIKITLTEPNNSDNNEIISLPFVNTPDREGILNTGTVPKEKLKILGKGTYGTVVKAIYKDKQIAVKVVKQGNSSLQRERNALNLNHSNIVKTLKVVCEANKNYGVVIMEDCSDAINMQTILDKCEFIELPDIVKWCLDICSGIQYCHEKNILHLDIKPKNILVQGNTCKICDFGNSVNIKCMAQISYTNQGTVGYTAPELFQNMMPNCSADIYSLGITMWQMESRHLPYMNLDSKDAIIYFVVKHNLRPTKAKHVKSEYSDIYQRCWVADKTLRPSIKEVINILKQF